MNEAEMKRWVEAQLKVLEKRLKAYIDKAIKEVSK